MNKTARAIARFYLRALALLVMLAAVTMIVYGFTQNAKIMGCIIGLFLVLLSIIAADHIVHYGE